MFDLLDRLFHFGQTTKQRQLRRGRAALAGFRLDSIWLHKRPFSDQYDGDDHHGGYFSGGGGGGRSVADDGPNRNI
ncbi:hypothetical protein [Paractinoplanes toevensis]|uniref:Uncharacterized protein n=1 Tax=Paractinoplanes toevensis TaxID=571911 RepID=A0A919W079_9ACTN|nr:hypothetical protein [Actinoplanes toevensis]GIM88894.1 hypothetical protein Ato02nite_006870 [Actinoplanes toevensis]